MAITFNHNDKFYVNGSNVGIGTDSPNGKLDIVLDSIGGLKIDTNSDGGATITTYQGSTNNNVRQIEFNVQNFQVKTGIPQGTSTTDALFIDSSQNVGIGTTSPDLKLHLAHSDGNNGLLLEHTSQASGFQVLQNIRETEGLIWQRWANGAFASNLMTLTYSGELGIGTTSPDQKLQIHDSSSTGVYLHVTNSTTGEDGGNGALFGISSNEEALVWNYENTATRFSTNGTERMRITPDGFVGIGTTNPLEELEVKSSSFTTVSVNTDRNTAGENIGSFAFYGYNSATTPENMWYTRIMSSMTDVTDGSENGDIFFQQLNDGTGLETFRVKSSGTIQFPTYGAGYLRTDADGNVIVDTSTVEDTLDTVTTRGNSTTNSIVVGGVGSSGEIALYSTGTADATNTEYDSHVLRFSTSGWDTNNSVARNVHWNIRSEASSNIYPDAYLTFYEENISYNHWKLKLPGRGSGSSYIHPDAALFNGNIGIYESDTSNVKISLKPTGDSYFTNNLGIGTTSPVAKLDVRTSSDHIAEFITTTADSLAYIRVMNNAQSSTDTDTAAAAIELVARADDSAHGRHVWIGAEGVNNTDYRTKLKFKIRNGANDFDWSGTYEGPTIMTLDGNGNVGIGTTSPNVLFDVNKSAIGEYAYFGSGSTRQLRLSSYNTVSDHAGHKINASSANGEIILATGGTDAITIKNDQTIQLNAYGAGYLKTDASGNITVDTDTIEDTLDSVTDRGNTTTNSISVGEVTLSNAPASNNGTFVKVYSDNHKRMYTATLNFSFTAAGTYNFNLVFPNSGGYQYELTAVNSRNGLYRNFGTLKDSSYIYWESDEDFTHRAEGDLHMISSYTGGMYFSADTTYFLSDGVTDSVQTGTANWSYAIVRYSIYIPRYDGDVTGSWKLHLTTYGDTGSGSPQFVLA